jgi:hypothetical protein
VTSQSSNSARSVAPAWPLKVTSCIGELIKVTPHSLLFVRAASMPGR